MVDIHATHRDDQNHQYPVSGHHPVGSAAARGSMRTPHTLRTGRRRVLPDEQQEPRIIPLHGHHSGYIHRYVGVCRRNNTRQGPAQTREVPATVIQQLPVVKDSPHRTGQHTADIPLYPGRQFRDGHQRRVLHLVANHDHHGNTGGTHGTVPVTAAQLRSGNLYHHPYTAHTADTAVRTRGKLQRPHPQQYHRQRTDYRQRHTVTMGIRGTCRIDIYRQRI